jgi:energy-coupling factor transporter ATP-binding protein EcfA2
MMKITSIDLSWFRGAADSASLNTEFKNIAIYGANGSGKSTFCDAIEYLIMEGKIDHLRHEYSGVRQEKGIRNTHAPKGAPSTISVQFEGDISIHVTIDENGSPVFTSAPSEFIDFIQSWKLEQLVLRQDEVARFVIKPKGDKYSALLPLLGLQNLEQAASNLNTLNRYILERSDLVAKTERLKLLKEGALKYLPEISEKAVLEILRKVAERHISGEKPTKRSKLITILAESISKSVESLEPAITRYTLLTQIRDENLPNKIDVAINTHNKVAGRLDAFLDSRIEILQSAEGWINKLDKLEGKINCPACGRPISIEDFAGHVRSELKTLEELASLRSAARSAQSTLKGSLDKVKGFLTNEAISSWPTIKTDPKLNEAISGLSKLDLATWQREYPAEDIAKVSALVPVILMCIKPILDATPPSNKELVNDLRIVEACEKVDEIQSLEGDLNRIKRIAEGVTSGENAIRSHLKTRTGEILAHISGDIQNFWDKLHPGEPIEDVKLYIPSDADKAIDICLKFFGVEQPSPRLTLSEGHRNSLGLCIFLALSRCGDSETRPIFLDDVVSSWDREHRGMLTGILNGGLGNRQIFLFTHDREWFHELRIILPTASWKFLVLKPWNNPAIGLQWSESQNTLDDAKILIDQNPEAAGNRVRAIMDTQLAIIAERLQIDMPYKRGDRNDHRTCIEFCEKIISDGKKRFRKKIGNSWAEFKEPIEDWQKMHSLLIAWADRGSHTGSLVPNEVEQLIQTCETALSRFKCANCESFVWSADSTSQERLQCTCGDLQWRYG